MLPPGIAESAHLIQAVDQVLVAGFVNLSQTSQTTLHRLRNLYRGTPLDQVLAAGMDDLLNGVFHPTVCMGLATARAALQGAQYDCLLRQIRDDMGRSGGVTPVSMPEPLEHPPPLLASTRHWLMDLAVTGFSRLETATISAFSSTLEQLQADATYLRTAAVVSGFMHELLLRPEEIPLVRWGDLWSRAMITTLSTNAAPDIQPVNGTLYPLGIDWRQHATLVRFVVYGVLETNESAQLVTITKSAYKVGAIQREQLWLLFPEASLLLESLGSGQALRLRDMPTVAGGHLLWEAQAAEIGNAYNAMEVALAYFAPAANRPVTQWALNPEQRHPVHLFEPIALTKYQVVHDQGDCFLHAAERVFKLDLRHTVGTELTIEAIEAAQRFFGLLRFDGGEWLVQPLYASTNKGKATFIGSESGTVLKKVPKDKDNAVGILKERASRLLREKS